MTVGDLMDAMQRIKELEFEIDQIILYSEVDEYSTTKNELDKLRTVIAIYRSASIE